MQYDCIKIVVYRLYESAHDGQYYFNIANPLQPVTKTTTNTNNTNTTETKTHNKQC